MSKPRIFETFCMREDLDNRKDLQSSKKCAVSSTDSQVRQKGTSVFLINHSFTKINKSVPKTIIKTQVVMIFD